MKRVLTGLAFLCTLSLVADLHAENDARTYYFQMICGSDKDLSKRPGAKPIGEKLRNQLESPFRWKHFADVSHGEFVLPSDHGRALIKLPENRELRVHRTGNQIEAQLYRNGQLLRTTRGAASAHSLIMGGDQGQGEEGCWFVVLRSDKPTTITAAAQSK
jgi:hypothetical protein